jgi:hypothetical protein
MLAALRLEFNVSQIFVERVFYEQDATPRFAPPMARG